MPIFTADELQRRQARVLSRLDDAEALVITSFHNSYYASGFPMRQFGRFCVTVLFRDSDPVILAPVFEEAGVRAQSPVGDIRPYRDEGAPLDVVSALVADVLRERGVRRVGIEADGMPAGMADRLRSALPQASFTDKTLAIDEERLVSSTEELGYLRQAVAIADAGMTRLLELLRPGIDETELASAAVQAMRTLSPPGADVHANCYMQQNLRTAECHASAMPVPVGDEGFIELLVECEVWHYQASIERPVLLPTASDAVSRACSVAHEAFVAARSAVAPGVRYCDVDAVSRAHFHQAGYDDVMSGAGLVRNVLHHTGGRIDIGELRPYNTRQLRSGVSLTIEPWALVAGVGAPRFCDPILVTEGGWERLGAVPDGTLAIGHGGIS